MGWLGVLCFLSIAELNSVSVTTAALLQHIVRLGHIDRPPLGLLVLFGIHNYYHTLRTTFLSATRMAQTSAIGTSPRKEYRHISLAEMWQAQQISKLLK